MKQISLVFLHNGRKHTSYYDELVLRIFFEFFRETNCSKTNFTSEQITLQTFKEVYSDCIRVLYGLSRYFDFNDADHIVARDILGCRIRVRDDWIHNWSFAPDFTGLEKTQATEALIKKISKMSFDYIPENAEVLTKAGIPKRHIPYVYLGWDRMC